MSAHGSITGGNNRAPRTVYRKSRKEPDMISRTCFDDRCGGAGQC